jgi:hypothetical protein
LLPSNLPHSPRQVTGYRTCRSRFFQKKATIGSDRPNLSAEEELIVVVCFVCFAALLSRTVASSFEVQNRLKCCLVQQHSSRPQILANTRFYKLFQVRHRELRRGQSLRDRGSTGGEQGKGRRIVSEPSICAVCPWRALIFPGESSRYAPCPPLFSGCLWSLVL